MKLSANVIAKDCLPSGIKLKGYACGAVDDHLPHHIRGANLSGRKRETDRDIDRERELERSDNII